MIFQKLIELREDLDKNQREIASVLGISQQALADLLNTSHSTISAYESGKTLILTAFAYQISKQ